MSDEEYEEKITKLADLSDKIQKNTPQGILAVIGDKFREEKRQLIATSGKSREEVERDIAAEVAALNMRQP